MRTTSNWQSRVGPLAITSLLLAWALAAAAGVKQPGSVSPDSAADSAGGSGASGDLQVPSFLLPPSGFMSSEASAELAKIVAANANRPSNAAPMSAEQRRSLTEKEMQPRLAQALALFPVDVHPDTVGGVSVNVVEPKAGSTQNHGKVLIELAGGAFTTATPTGGLLESVPVANLSGMRVISVHYRQGPENRFPAASEDVAAVYSELLKHYRASAIGIYGCSSGAYLTTMSVAWFQVHHLPRPGAIALLCGSAGRIFEGDSFFTAPASMGKKPPLPVSAERPVVQVEYMRDIRSTDPLALPINFPDVLAKFPPTLFITGSRDQALSSAIYMHSRLVELGVKADLHVWDGMWHGFMEYPTLPETRAAAGVIAKFFDQELAQ